MIRLAIYKMKFSPLINQHSTGQLKEVKASLRP